MAGLCWPVPVWVQPALKGVARIEAALAMGALLVLQVEHESKGSRVQKNGSEQKPTEAWAHRTDTCRL